MRTWIQNQIRFRKFQVSVSGIMPKSLIPKHLQETIVMFSSKVGHKKGHENLLVYVIQFLKTKPRRVNVKRQDET